MTYIEKSLAPGEAIVAMFHLHWLVWVRVWIVLVIGAIVVAFLLWLATAHIEGAGLGSAGWAALAVAVIALFIAGSESLNLHAIEQGVTNHRVIRKIGLIARHSTELRLASIETVDLRQSFWGRILRYANIEITGRGETAMVLRRLADPIGVKRAIETAYSQHVESVHAGPVT
ncbi:MAG: PH domain-containing protein [Rhodanobacteraceae bacterium]